MKINPLDNLIVNYNIRLFSEKKGDSDGFELFLRIGSSEDYTKNSDLNQTIITVRKDKEQHYLSYLSFKILQFLFVSILTE